MGILSRVFINGYYVTNSLMIQEYRSQPLENAVKGQQCADNCVNSAKDVFDYLQDV